MITKRIIQMEYVITSETKGMQVMIAVREKVKRREMKKQNGLDGDDDELVLCFLISEN